MIEKDDIGDGPSFLMGLCISTIGLMILTTIKSCVDKNFTQTNNITSERKFLVEQAVYQCKELEVVKDGER
jgi:hypothetical protein